ncbi:hypothetical protein AN958_00260 [Leucoagaricus sp. SymC.cos]|nr:hypothetical protein AN958_00260 [Leucoagaricus sp. SymC.cos]
MVRINLNYLYKKFRKWKNGLSRNQGSILIQLRSGHLPINTYLKKIQKCKDNPCEWCKEREGWLIPKTVNHFTLDCPAYKEEREEMKQKLG